MCPPEQVPAYRDAARAYLRQLFDTATLKTAGSLPIFPKRYLGAGAAGLHDRVHLWPAGDGAVRGATPAAALACAIPDFIDLAASRGCVWSSSRSARAAARGCSPRRCPGMKTIFILRDPWGQVASMQRGAALGKFEERLPVAELLMTEQAARYGLTAARFASAAAGRAIRLELGDPEREGDRGPGRILGVMVLRYQALCASPLPQARALFDFAALDWDPQTEAFLAAAPPSADATATTRCSGTPRRRCTAGARSWHGGSAPDHSGGAGDVACGALPGTGGVGAERNAHTTPPLVGSGRGGWVRIANCLGLRARLPPGVSPGSSRSALPPGFRCKPTESMMPAPSDPAAPGAPPDDRRAARAI